MIRRPTFSAVVPSWPTFSPPLSCSCPLVLCRAEEYRHLPLILNGTKQNKKEMQRNEFCSETAKGIMV